MSLTERLSERDRPLSATPASPIAEPAEPAEPPAQLAATPSPQLSAETLPSPAVVLISGGLAGIASRTATAPLDRLKTLMQVGPPMGVRRPMALDGVRNGLREILRAGGLASFWQGNGTNCIKVMPESAIRFWTYDAVKARVCRDPRCPSGQERLVAGAAAGFVSCLAIYPMEVIKTRMAVAKQGQFGSIAACVRATVKHEGLGALYKVRVRVRVRVRARERTAGKPMIAACTLAVAPTLTLTLTLTITLTLTLGAHRGEAHDRRVHRATRHLARGQGQG